jgi:hypothetical protein
MTQERTRLAVDGGDILYRISLLMTRVMRLRNGSFYKVEIERIILIHLQRLRCCTTSTRKLSRAGLDGCLLCCLEAPALPISACCYLENR